MVSTVRAHKGDVIAIGVLVGLAVASFGLPSVLGRPVMPGDDMTQNYPLRVLVGEQIRAGHLPVFDPFIWSGSPLLGGWNAGAAYPLTWLFAVLPGVTAWTVGLVVTFVTAGVGMFGFLRLGPRLGTVASFAGALTFAFAGAMGAQVTHFGVVAGMSWVPLGLLAVHRLTARPGPALAGGPATAGGPAADGPGRGAPAGPQAGPADAGSAAGAGGAPGPGGVRSRLGWTGLLALTTGLIVLAAEPRSIADGLAVLGLYAVWRVACLGRRCLPGIGWLAGGLVLGIMLSAIQVLPGLAAIDTSQRAGSGLALFSSGSLPRRWLLLMLVPDLLGGSGTGSQPSFFASYNLTEVNGYIGILPLVAAFALLAQLPWSVRRAQVPEWLVWHLTAVIGVLLALGGNTPLGPLLARVPFFGTQRLQSRNILVADLALAILLAYWADHPFPARAARPADGQGRSWLRRLSPEVILGALPAVAVIGVAVTGLAGGLVLFEWLTMSTGLNAAVIGSLRPWLIPFLVLGGAALALVIVGRRLPRRLFARLIAGLAVIDIIAFSALTVVQISAPVATRAAAPAASAVTTSSHTAPSAAGPAASVPHLSTRPITQLGYPGRFVIYDPDLIDIPDLSVLQPPDVNSLSRTPAVQGYTSIVDGAYATATGSHQADGQGQNTLSPAAVSNGTLDSLDTTILLTLPQYATGTLRDVLTAPHWVLAGYDGRFAIYRNQRARGPLTLRPLSGRSIQGASVTGVTGLSTEPRSATVTSRSGVVVVRSVAYIPGWSASWQPAGGGKPARQLPVRADGVVQAVSVPAGTGVLTWTYTPPRLMAGLVLSLTATLAIIVMLLVAAVGRNLSFARQRALRARQQALRAPREGAIGWVR